jgi:hypothetical protein
VQLLAERVDFAARLADDDAGPRGVDVDGDLAAALDRDVGEPGVGELADDVIADLRSSCRRSAKFFSSNQFDFQSWM